MVAALRERLPGQPILEARELGWGEAPVVVVFVISAIAPLSEDDAALFDAATQYTDAVIAVVSKIDWFRNWPAKLAADRSLLQARGPRYDGVVWVGAAAAPAVGEPQLDELVQLLSQRLGDAETHRRNQLRTLQTRLQTSMARYQSEGAGQDREARVEALRYLREDVWDRRDVARAEHLAALNGRIRLAYGQLTEYAGQRCGSVRTELHEDVSTITRRRMRRFEPYVRRRADEVVDEVNEGITDHLADVANELGLSPPPAGPPPLVDDVPAPVLPSRRLWTGLFMLLGALLGASVAVSTSWLIAGPARVVVIAAGIAGALVGLLVVTVVLWIRRRRRDRVILHAWVARVTETLLPPLEELVGHRVRAADGAFSRELSALEETADGNAADTEADINAELREHAISTARAAELRDRRLPELREALASVRAELSGGEPDEPAARGQPDSCPN
jgi:hypothetical protein